MNVLKSHDVTIVMYEHPRTLDIVVDYIYDNNAGTDEIQEWLCSMHMNDFPEGIEQYVKVYTVIHNAEQYIPEDYIDSVISEAQRMFWEHVATKFPWMKSGDFAPHDQHDFDQACIHAVKAWYLMNVNS